MEETVPRMNETVPGQVKATFESLAHRTFDERVIEPDAWEAIDAKPPSQDAVEFIPPASVVYAYEESGSSRREDAALKHVWTYCLFATPSRVIVTLYQSHLLPFLETALQRAADATNTEFKIHAVISGRVQITHGIWPKSTSRKIHRLAFPA
jgi:hypothetical protein